MPILTESDPLLQPPDSLVDQSYSSTADMTSSINSDPSPSVAFAPATATAQTDAARVLIKTYKRRWYILAVYSLLGFMQCAIWNTWGPITQAALLAFPSWTDLTISCLTNIGLFAFLVFMAPYFWLLVRKGVRPAILTMAICLAAGTTMRCFTSQHPYFDILVFISAALAGIAGVMALAAPPYISALWFPPNQRTTATGIPNIMNQLGMSGSFLLGPLIVSQPVGPSPDPHPGVNTTLSPSLVFGRTGEAWLSSNGTSQADLIQQQIFKLLYIDAAICVVLFLMVCVYFPSRPPLPPSPSASASSSVSFLQGLRLAFRNRDLACIVITYSLSQGIMGSWFGVMDINLSSLGVTENESSLLGMWAGVSCCSFALLVARLTDVFRGHIKVTIVLLLSGGCIFWCWLLAIVAGWAPFSLVYLYCCVLGAVSCTYAASPLLFEYASELSYPVPEDVVGALMSFCFNLVGGLYLLLFLNKHLASSTVWLNYCLSSASVLAVIMLILTRSVYRRSAFDASASLAQSAESVSGYRPL